MQQIQLSVFNPFTFAYLSLGIFNLKVDKCSHTKKERKKYFKVKFKQDLPNYRYNAKHNKYRINITYQINTIHNKKKCNIAYSIKIKKSSEPLAK